MCNYKYKTYARFQILVNTDILVLEFYGYIINIEKNIGGYFDKKLFEKMIKYVIYIYNVKVIL